MDTSYVINIMLFFGIRFASAHEPGGLVTVLLAFTTTPRLTYNTQQLSLTVIPPSFCIALPHSRGSASTLQSPVMMRGVCAVL